MSDILSIFSLYIWPLIDQVETNKCLASYAQKGEQNDNELEW